MTEIAVAAAAFDAELGKALASLPPCPAAGQHEAVLTHQRVATKVLELCDHYVSKKLPLFAFAPRLLATGAELMERGEYELAASACFARLVQLNLPQVAEVSKLDVTGKLSIHVQALYGLHSSRAALAVKRDPHITHIVTLQAVLQALAGIKEGCMQAVPNQQLYWLVFNATVHLHKAAGPLVAAGYYAEGLPYYVFAAKVLESHLTLSSSQFLPWRLQMYAAAAHCYGALQAAASVNTASESADTAAPATVSPGRQAAGSKGASNAGAAADGPPSGGVRTGADAYDALAVKFLQDGLAEVNRAQARTNLDPVPPPAAVTTALQVAQSEFAVLKTVFEAGSRPADKGVAATAGTRPSTASLALQSALAAIKQDSLKLHALLGVLLAGQGSSRQPLQQVQLPQNLQPVLDAAVALIAPALDAKQDEQQAPSQWETLTEQLHLSFLSVAYRYSQQELLQKLLAAAKARMAATPESNGYSSSLAATAAVLEAVQELQQDSGPANLQQLAVCLKQHSTALAQCFPGILAAAAIKLHAAAEKLFRGCFSIADSEAALVQILLEGLHEALQASDCTDGVLRGCVALRLAVMLQQKQQLDAAVSVVQQGILAISTARCNLLWHLHGAPDEHFRWITGSRTQANDATAALVAGMTSTEQDLACLHADALIVLQSLQVAVGLRDAAAKATFKKDRMLASTLKRDRESDIYGPRTMKEKRLDDLAVEAAGKAPNRNESCERELLQKCGKNQYQRALLLTQIAAVQPNVERQAALLEEACDLLSACQMSEAELFASQQPAALNHSSSNPHARLLQPKVLRRTPNSITITHFPLETRGYRQPTSFAVYCKATGAGVALTINKTAMEYPGSGVKVPLGSRITIEGLQSDETYVFAIAVYDDQGDIIGELGLSTPNIVMALPLPLYTCWAHVLLTAAQLQQWTAAKRAAVVFLPRFIAKTPVRPVWQAHPMDRYQLQLQQVQAAAVPLLRLLVQAVYVYAYHLAQQHVAQDACAKQNVPDNMGSSGLAGTAASRTLLLQYRESRVPDQIALLEYSKELLTAMQVAAIIGDEMLVEEGALRTYDLLTPLLQQQDISPLVHQALSTLHLALTAVQDTAQASVAGHSEQRLLAARVTAAASFWLMRLSAPVSPILAAGAAVSAAAGVTGRLMQPAAAFAKLDCAILKALSWQALDAQKSADGASSATADQKQKQSTAATAAEGKSKGGKSSSKQAKVSAEAAVGAAAITAAKPIMSVPEEVALAEQQVEITASQDLVLLHPDGAAWASPGISTRMQNAADLVAQVLPNLSKSDPLSNCWPLLSPESARSHPRWLQLCVLVIQAAAKQHSYALILAMPPAAQDGLSIGLGVSAADTATADMKVAQSPGMQTAAALAAELLAAVQQHVRLAARKPQLLQWPHDTKWTVDAAAAALQAQGFMLGDQGTLSEPAAPETAHLAASMDQAAAMAAVEQQKAELLTKESRRLAAALLLQQRLPLLLKRRRHILQTRQRLACWAPWLAYLRTLLGSLAAEAAYSVAASKPIAATLTPFLSADSGNDVGSTVNAVGDGLAVEGQGAFNDVEDLTKQAGDRPASASRANTNDGSNNQSPPKKGAVQSSRQVTPRVKDAKDAAQPVDLEQIPVQLGLQALQQLAQAATLASRAGPSAWQELLNSTKQLWNVCRSLINRLPALSLPAAPAAWVPAVLPAPKVPSLAAEAADRGSTAADGTGKVAAAERRGAADKAGKGPGADKKTAAGAAGVAGKGGKAGMPLVPEAAVKQLLLPEARGPNAATPLKAAAEALLCTMEQLKAGAQFHSGILPVQPSHSGSSAAPGPVTEAPLTSRSNKSASGATEFSLGSDAVVTNWHAGGPVDVAALTRLMMVVLKVLQRMERWGSVMSIGQRWLDVCEGSADAMLLPLLLGVAPKAGALESEMAALTAAHQACLRDKNTALDALDKVRAATAERISDLPLLAQLGGNAFKRSRRSGAAAALKSGSNTSRSYQPDKSVTITSTDAAMRTARSVAGTNKTAGAGADHVFLPAEYEKVVEVLKQRGEKGHMILAQNELGDVFAHFGMWTEAAGAWSSALDALLGPYQVVTNWTSKLELGCSWQELLARYGVHGLLLAGVLLGKLARYIYYGDLGSRLSCARLAGELLPAVFAASIVHPQRAVDCAMYVPVEIWPGVDLFDDAYRCNAPDLLSSLETLSTILLDHHLHLQALPLLSLWEHVACHVIHNTSSLVLCRVKRVLALSQIGLLAEAGVVLQGLMQGNNLPGLLLHPPQPVLTGAENVATGQHATTETKSPSKDVGSAAGTGVTAGTRLVYNTSKWPSHPDNVAFQNYVAEAALPGCVAALYGPWLCGQVVLARAAWLAAVGSVPNCWKSACGPAGDAAGSAAAPVTANSNQPAAGSGTAAKSTGVGNAATAAATSLETVESKLLDKAASLIQAMLSASRSALGMPALHGCSWDQDEHGAAAVSGSATARGRSSSGTGKAVAAKTGKGAKGGKTGKGSDKNKRDAAVAAAGATPSAAGSESGAGPSAAELLLQAQHQQLLVAGLLQLAEVEALRWMPGQALQLSLLASSIFTAGSSGRPSSIAGLQCTGVAAWQATGCGNDDLERVALQPATWLTGRWQLARLLLQLQHYAACVTITSKAIDDAKSLSDCLWTVQLQHVQANALAAQGDAAAALTVMRNATARLQSLAVPGPILLSVQLDCALLCEQIGARGEFDRLANQNLAVSSSSIVEQLGLQEMLENNELLNIYMPATTAHLATTLLAATAATRRRQLATAEKLLRQAVTLLGCCRCLPTTAAQVALQLGQVLRLQAAMKLPATDMVLAKTSTTASQRTVTGTSATADAGVTLRGTELQLQRLNEAATHVTNALQLLVRDGGSQPALIRPALLELAAIWLYIHQLNAATTAVEASSAAGAAAVDVSKVASALQAAHITASQLRTLYLTNHQLQPVIAAALPAWLLELLKGQEQLQQSLQQQSSQVAAAAASDAGKSGSKHKLQQQLSTSAVTAAGSEAAIADGTLGRLALCQYVRQLTAAADGLGGMQQRQLAAAQALVIQAALKTACPKLATECCWSDVPPSLPADAADAASIPLGSVIVQWFHQDCCWQQPSSWRSDGILPPSKSGDPITRDILHELPGIQAYVSCLYVIHAPALPTAAAAGSDGTAGASGVSAAADTPKQQLQQQPKLLVGEVVVHLERLKKVQLQVKMLRQRLESPGRPTDLFALPPPSPRELAAVKHSLEGMLSGIDKEDMGQPPIDLPPPPAPPTAVAVATAAATGAPGAKAGGTPAAAASAKGAAPAATKAGTAAKPGAATQAPAAVAVDTGPESLVLDWRDLNTWIRMEALLDVADGLQGSEGGVALWLAQLLTPASHAK